MNTNSRSQTAETEAIFPAKIDRRHFLFAAGGFNVYPTVRSIPPPFRGDPKQAELWVQVLTWQEMDQHGVLTWLDQATWKARRDELEKLGGPTLK